MIADFAEEVGQKAVKKPMLLDKVKRLLQNVMLPTGKKWKPWLLKPSKTGGRLMF